jgi:hypothetical protein
MDAAFDMSMFDFATPTETKRPAAADTTLPQEQDASTVESRVAAFDMAEMKSEISVLTSCEKLMQQMLPQIQPRVEHLRKKVKVSIHFRRNVCNATDKNVPSSIRTIFAEYGKDIKLLLQYIQYLPLSGRKLDHVLFRSQDECKYNIVRISNTQARLAKPTDDVNNVENFNMRESLQKLIQKTTRGQVDVFARGDLYQHETIVFATAQLILFNWCRKNAVIKHVLTQVPTDIRAQSRKRKSATIVRQETNPRKRSV